MIIQFLKRHDGLLWRATLVGSGIICFLVPAGGLYKLVGLGLTGAQGFLGLAIVAGLTIQSMILFTVVALAEEIFVKRPNIH